jgi:hypothetical protein
MPSSASTIVKGRHLDYCVGDCLRASYYYLTNTLITNPQDGSILPQELGRMVELFLVNALREANVLESPTTFGSQPAVWDKDLALSGFMDAAVRTTLDGAQYPLIVEVKSFQGYKNHKLIMGGSQGRGSHRRHVPPSPRPWELLQVAVYLHYFLDEVPGAKMIYFARDTMDKVEIDVCLDSEGRIYVDGRLQEWVTTNDVMSRYRLLQESVRDSKIPPRDYSLKYTQGLVQSLYDETTTAPDDDPARYLITKSEFDQATQDLMQKGRTSVGDYHCKYCKWQRQCYKVDI